MCWTNDGGAVGGISASKFCIHYPPPRKPSARTITLQLLVAPRNFATGKWEFRYHSHGLVCKPTQRYWQVLEHWLRLWKYEVRSRIDPHINLSGKLLIPAGNSLSSPSPGFPDVLIFPAAVLNISLFICRPKYKAKISYVLLISRRFQLKSSKVPITWYTTTERIV